MVFLGARTTPSSNVASTTMLVITAIHFQLIVEILHNIRPTLQRRHAYKSWSLIVYAGVQGCLNASDRVLVNLFDLDNNYARVSTSAIYRRNWIGYVSTASIATYGTSLKLTLPITSTVVPPSLERSERRSEC